MRSKTSLAMVLVCLLALMQNGRADITSGLVLYLPLNETSGATAFDSSGLAHNATYVSPLAGDAQWTTGWLAGGVNINNPFVPGQTNYLTIPTTPDLSFDTGKHFTLACWVKMPTAQIGGAALIAHGTGGGGEQYDLDINASKFRIVTRFPPSAAVTLSSVANVSPNWQHVVVAWDGTKSNMTMYVNGQLGQGGTLTTANLAAVVSSTTPVTIGARQGASGPYNLYMTNTVVDEVRIYNRTFTAADANELYSLGSFGNPNGTVPTFPTQPRGITNYAGDIATFTPAVTGIPAGFFYQWLSNNVAIPNQTNATLALTNVQLSSSAAYSVQVSNIVGSATSAPANLLVQSLPAANITANLAGYWKFDEASGSSVAADSSGNGNAGTLTGFVDLSTVWVAGITNGALNFNGDITGADLVAVPAVGTAGPASMDFSLSPAFTLATWVKAPTSLVQSNGGGIICRGSGGGGEQYNLDLPTAGYRFFVRNAAGTAILINTTIKPNGTWQHLAAVFDGANGIQNFYVNGQLVGVTVAPFSLSTNASTHEVAIGNRQSAAAAYNLPFSGAMDDTRIYSRALTSADVQALYLSGGVYPPTFSTQPQSASRFIGDDVIFSPVVNGTLPINYQWRKGGTNIPGATNLSLSLTNVQLTNAATYALFVSNGYGTNLSDPAVLQVNSFILTNSLAAFWKFDENSGTTINDSSSNANHGFISGSDFQWVSGRIGSALSFNSGGAAGTYVSIPDSASVNFDTSLQFSISVWVRGSASQISGAAILAKGTGSGGEQYALDVFTGTFRFYVRNSAAVATTLVSSTIPPGNWLHVAATFDGSTGAMRIYINGQLAGSATGPTTLLATSHEVSIGNRQSASAAYNLPFIGMIDDVRIYNRPLNSYDVQQLYSSAAPLSPIIYTLQPPSGSVLAGDSVSFSASVDGDAPLSYQWTKGATIITTNLGFTINNVNLTDSGTYTFQVSNGGGSASSNTVITVGAVPAPALASSLIAYWPFDETTGTSVADSSGNGNSVSLYNFAGDDSQWGPGRIGGALHMNANGLVNDQFGSTDNPLSLQNGDLFSFSFWAKLDPGPNGVNPRFITPSSTHWVLWSPGRGVGLFTPSVSTEPSSNSWTHFVVVVNRPLGTYTLYVNGTREVANAGPYPKADPTGLFWAIGHSESGTATTDSWTGLLDDMRIYNRLLNVNDTKALYYFAGGQPSLSITRNGSAVTISWSSVATGYQLQSTDTLGASAVWGNVPGTPAATADGLAQTITVTADASAKFYRLQK